MRPTVHWDLQDRLCALPRSAVRHAAEGQIASDVMSQWAGENVQISRAFRIAAQEGALSLIEAIDSFLQTGAAQLGRHSGQWKC